MLGRSAVRMHESTGERATEPEAQAAGAPGALRLAAHAGATGAPGPSASARVSRVRQTGAGRRASAGADTPADASTARAVTYRARAATPGRGGRGRCRGDYLGRLVMLAKHSQLAGVAEDHDLVADLDHVEPTTLRRVQ